MTPADTFNLLRLANWNSLHDDFERADELMAYRDQLSDARMRLKSVSSSLCNQIFFGHASEELSL